MAHFPASVSMNRLAGSSDTQKVCRMTKSSVRTGDRRRSKSRARHLPAHAVPDGQSVKMTKSRRSGQSQTPEALIQ